MADVKVRLSLEDGSHIDIDKKNGLKSVETISQRTGQPKDLFYGVISNTGSAQLIDENGDLLSLVEEDIISNSNVSIISNGDTTAKHICVDSEYDNNSRLLTLEFSDKLSFWETLMYQGYNYMGFAQDAYTLLEDVLISIGYNEDEISEMLSQEILFGDKNEIGTVKDYLSRIIIEYPYLKKDTIKNTIDKFCRLAQLQVFQQKNGFPIFVSARPIATTSELNNTIDVPKNRQLSQLSKSVVLKNKYDAIEIEAKEPVDIIKYNETLDTVEVPDSYTLEPLVYRRARGTVSTVGTVPTKAWGVCFIEKDYYVEGSFTIPKKSNYNLSEILNIKTETPYELFNVTADKIKINSYGSISIDEENWNEENVSALMSDPIDLEELERQEVVETLRAEEVKLSVPNASITATPENQSQIWVTENNDEYIVEYRILAKQEKWELSVDGTTNFIV